MDDDLELEKANVAPCNAELFREAGEANRGLAAAISPFISPLSDPARAPDRERLKRGVDGGRLETLRVALQLVRTAKMTLAQGPLSKADRARHRFSASAGIADAGSGETHSEL